MHDDNYQLVMLSFGRSVIFFTFINETYLSGHDVSLQKLFHTNTILWTYNEFINLVNGYTCNYIIPGYFHFSACTRGVDSGGWGMHPPPEKVVGDDMYNLSLLSTPLEISSPKFEGLSTPLTKNS